VPLTLLSSCSDRSGSPRGWGISYPQAGQAGKPAGQPVCPAHKPNICSDKDLEVPCPQICPSWGWSWAEQPAAVSFHLKGSLAVEGGDQGFLHPPCIFVGRWGKRSQAHSVPVGNLEPCVDILGTARDTTLPLAHSLVSYYLGQSLGQRNGVVQEETRQGRYWQEQ
jgi:hypothetical protein